MGRVVACRILDGDDGEDDEESCDLNEDGLDDSLKDDEDIPDLLEAIAYLHTAIDPGLMAINLRPPEDIYDGQTHIFRFESWGDFVERAANGHSDMAYDRRASRALDTQHNKSWAGTDTFQEAVDLARNGWPEGAQLAKAQLRFLEDLIPSHVMRSEPAYSQVGPGVLDFERLRMEHPEPYMTFVPVEREEYGQIVHVNYTVSASAGVSTDAMIQKGVVIAALIDLLEQSGKRVELIMTGGTSSGYNSQSPSLILEVIVKRAQDPLDLERLVMIAHPATHRRLHFSIKEQAHEDIRSRLGIDINGGYGMPVSVPHEGAINIDAWALGEGYRPEQTIKWLQEMLRKQGVMYDV